MNFATPTAATCSFVLDEATLSHAQRRAVNLVPRGTQAAVGLAGGLVGAAILGQVAKSDFHARLLTPAGHYGLSVSETGLHLTGFGDQSLVVQWANLDAWGVDETVFMAQDVRGNRLVLPRHAIPEPIFSMIVEICTITAKGAKRRVGRSAYGKWSQIGIGEKIVRGFIYTIGVLVLVLAMAIFVFSL